MRGVWLLVAALASNGWTEPLWAQVGQVAPPALSPQQAAPASPLPASPIESGTTPMEESSPPPPSLLPVDIGRQLFIDARTTGATQDGKRQILSGEVVVIGAGALITADKIELDQALQTLKASGHVVIMSDAQVFTGDAVEYHMESGDFSMTEAQMLTGDVKAVDDVSSQVLGFTKKELEFETQRQSRLNELMARKTNLLNESRRQIREKVDISPDLIEKYAVLLEEETGVKNQKNPALTSMSKERRESFIRRRDYWNSGRSSLLRAKGNLSKAYFKLKGRVLQRTNGNDFLARESLWTPCHCEQDESPAWGFRANRTEAQAGGYADLYHPVLEVKGIPVLYLPFLKIPLKSQRQSGFLPPIFGFETRSGSIYSQPVYFAFGPDTDATLNTDIFQNRGTRLGLEYRTQQREFSGWELKLEGMRDRLWMEERGTREVLGDMYRHGLEQAYSLRERPAVELPHLGGQSSRAYTEEVLGTPEYWRRLAGTFDADAKAKFDGEIDGHFALPTNTWRGAYVWRGVSYIAPRLSLVSHGEMASDHRYHKDLYMPDDFQDVFFKGQDSKSLSRAGARLHLDGTDFYGGVSSQYGDNYLTSDRFEGQQVPLRLKAQSRYLSLLPSSAPISLNGQLAIDSWRISNSEEKGSVISEESSLGEGTWRRAKFNTVAPLITNYVVQVSHFTEFEGRYIEHAELSSRRSEIRSWRTGIDLNLPIDGMGELPEVFQDAAGDLEFDENNLPKLPDPAKTGRRYGHHLMDWRLRFSMRPTVVATGPYLNAFDEQNLATGDNRLAYFATDRLAAADNDDDVADEDRMEPHRLITLSTEHNWRFLRRQWRRKAGEMSQPAADTPVAESSRDRARRELLYALDKPVLSANDLYDAVSQKWLIDRYTVTDQYEQTPLTFKAQIAYDMLDVDARRQQRALNEDLDTRIAALDAEIARLPEEAQAAPKSERTQLRRQKLELPEPWKDPEAELTARYWGWSLTHAITYSVYARTAKSLSLGLSTPTYAKTNVSVGYSQEKKVSLINQSFERTRERSVKLATSLIPPVTSYISLKRRVIDQEEAGYAASVYTAYGFEYLSSSDCWGLRFSREKDYGKAEAQASYLLQLSVIFVGQRQFLPNMAAGAVRELSDGETADD